MVKINLAILLFSVHPSYTALIIDAGNVIGISNASITHAVNGKPMKIV